MNAETVRLVDDQQRARLGARVGQLDERTPVYESVARHVVDTDGRTPEDVADEVDALLSGTGPGTDTGPDSGEDR